MKLLFAHDHTFYKNSENEVFSPGRLPYAIWMRYLDAFSELEVLGRAKPAGTGVAVLTKSSGPRVSFNFDHGLRSPTDVLLRRRQIVSAVARSVSACDAVVARLPSELGQLAVSCALRMKRPFAVEVVGCALDAYWHYGSTLARLYAPIMYLRMRTAVGAAPFALYVTQHFLQRRYPTSGTTVSVSNVQLQDISEEVLSQRLARIHEQSGSVVLGFIGSLHSAYKGLDTALKALHSLRALGHSVVLRILGDGEQGRWRELVQQLGLDNEVRFDGVLPGGRPVYDWLDTVDIFIQPSRQEGLPRSLIEAMSRGCPAIGSTAGGIPELLPPDCLHAPGDWRGLTARIRALALDQPRKAELATRNWEASRRYEASRLDNERRRFLHAFAAHAVRRAS